MVFVDLAPHVAAAVPVMFEMHSDLLAGVWQTRYVECEEKKVSALTQSPAVAGTLWGSGVLAGSTGYTDRVKDSKSLVL